MNRRVLIGVVPLLVAGVGAWWLATRGKGDGGKQAPTATPSPTPTRDRDRDRDRDEGPGPQAVAVLPDDDPPGSLRLEGQVIDAEENPIGGAVVRVSSNPPRETKSEEDGSFAFDALLSREYALTAWKDDLVGGPVTARLTDKSDPVILRMKPGGALEVFVFDRKTSRPIEGADVELRGPSDRAARTDRDGKATIRGVAKGWQDLRASAPGYATARRTVELSGAPGSVETQRISLESGASVSGTVVDENGRPVAGARVMPESMAVPWQSGDPRRDAAITDKQGAWTIRALPAGTFRFRARHAEHGPGASEPLTLDGGVDQKGVEIRLPAGGRVAGRVVDKAGAPVPLASVRVGSGVQGFDAQDRLRSQVCDEQGRFDIRGLPRTPLDLVASHETASSKLVSVDLSAKPEQTDVVITLDVEGVIAGIVVTPDGTPVPEAQVSAMPDLFGGGTPVREWSLRGFSEDVTDGGGRFELRGLPPGTYDVRASRGGGGDNPWSRRGTRAETGTRDLRVVLVDDGWVVGKVLLADGTAPDVFTVRTTMSTPVPFSTSDGSFRLDEVAPGKTTLTVNGPGFQEKSVPDVEIKPGAETNAGTITVERGRSISGRVLRPDGTPVAGALVLGGEYTIGDGSSIRLPVGTAQMPFKEAATDEDGAFLLRGVGPTALAVVAEHAEHGRSRSVQLPPGNESATIDLVLLPTGALQGRVLRGDKPVPQAAVACSSTTAVRGRFTVTTGDDGSYRFDKLAPDSYTLQAVVQGSGSAGGVRVDTVKVTVRSGETTTQDIRLASGGATVKVKGTQGGKPIAHGALVLAAGELRPKTVVELQEAAMSGGGGVTQELLNPQMNGVVSFPEVQPGAHTACAIVFPGSLADPAVIEQVTKNPGSLLLGCDIFQVAGSGEMAVSVEVPPAAPQ